MFAYHIVLLAMDDRHVRHMDGWMMSCRMIAYDDVVKRRTDADMDTDGDERIADSNRERVVSVCERGRRMMCAHGNDGKRPELLS